MIKLFTNPIFYGDIQKVQQFLFFFGVLLGFYDSIL